jgi:predicted small lipoprotein YifL
MNNKNLFTIVLLLIFSLSSCTSVKKILGLEKDVPNEFLIEKRDPLTLPPDYNILPPDSNAKINKNKESTSSLKSIFDKDLGSQKKSSSSNVPSNTKSIENDILKQIK